MRPVMCHALTRAAGASDAATAIAAIHASHTCASGTSQRGQRPARSIAAPHTTSDTTSAASRLLTACHGKRTSGFVVSNGATSASRNTPAAAAPLVTSVNVPTTTTAEKKAEAEARFEERWKNSKKLATRNGV